MNVSGINNYNQNSKTSFGMDLRHADGVTKFALPYLWYKAKGIGPKGVKFDVIAVPKYIIISTGKEGELVQIPRTVKTTVKHILAGVQELADKLTGKSLPEAKMAVPDGLPIQPCETPKEYPNVVPLFSNKRK